MYIFDCLYGRIEFKKKDYRCMISPEMQRLREVRLGNINSLWLTGSSNNNRYEHSIGTAYLAKVNIESNKSTFPKQYTDAFIHAALFHDLGNGPFGHSYEYILQKQGFIPEKSIADVIFGRKTGSHKKSDTCEPFYLGLQNELSNILSKEEVRCIDEIVRGENQYCSKLLSSTIDIDNIDNVYRMAFHMGLPVNKNAPVELAKGLICKNNQIYFKETAVPYLYDWYETRSNLYKLLLYNPQDFSAKCMLSELMENVLERDREKIKWQFTDSELVNVLLNLREEYWNEDALIPISINEGLKDTDFDDAEKIRNTFKKLGIMVSEQASISVSMESGKIEFSYYNTEYVFENGCLYKKGKKVLTNPSQLVTRMMRGDLYGCIGIYDSPEIEKYYLFSDKTYKDQLEIECNYYIEKKLLNKNYLVCFHGIVDKNKTNRQLEVQLESGELFQIGMNTHKLIIGAFLKNKNFGMACGEISSLRRKKLNGLIREFLSDKGISNTEHTLYSEVDCIE